MAKLSVHPPKKVIEVVNISFDFSDDLLPGEIFTANLTQVSLYSGIDPTPSDLLYQTVSVVGNVCTQKIKSGVVGVIYDVLLGITTNTGRIVQQVTRVAILPDNTPATPTYIPLYFTSRVYPVDVSEYYVLPDIAMLDGHSLENPLIVEWIQCSIAIQNGTLYNSSTTYNIPHEDMQAIPTILDGTLFGTTTTYNMLAEGVLPVISMGDGSLYGAVVSYDIPYEIIQSAIAITDGTLT